MHPFNSRNCFLFSDYFVTIIIILTHHYYQKLSIDRFDTEKYITAVQFHRSRLPSLAAALLQEQDPRKCISTD